MEDLDLSVAYGDLDCESSLMRVPRFLSGLQRAVNGGSGIMPVIGDV